MAMCDAVPWARYQVGHLRNVLRVVAKARAAALTPWWWAYGTILIRKA
jgi:hypothetical protein